jgi:CP family cyanate transporter-like MFS transporter
MTMNSPSLSARVARPALLIVGILLVAANLRAPITSVGPLLGMIRDTFDLGAAAAGALTTLPLLAFASISPLAARLARAYGLERALFGALILIGGGTVLRSVNAAWCLYLGTWIIGSGIAIGNVLLPSLLKRDFPKKIATLTAAYALTMGVAAALWSAIAVPLAHASGFGWPLALGTVVALPLITIILWLPQLGSHTAPASSTAIPPHGGRIWRAALAWQVTLFLGLNSLVYYIVIAWLPAILADSGYSPAQAGSIHGLLQLATAVPGLLLAPIVNRMKDQKAIAFGVAALATIGLVGLLLAPSWATLWTSLYGIGAGAAIILGLSFVSLRVTSSHQAAALSGMAQCVGYLLAAAGPTLVGVIHDVSGGWTVPLAACAILSLIMAILGLFAGRALHIAETTESKTKLADAA